MISTETARNDYVGNGTTADYDFTFKIFAESHIRVVINDDGGETTLVLGTDYSVEDIGEDAGGFISLINLNQDWLDIDGFLDDDISLTIIRNIPLTQDVDFKNQGEYFPEGHENADDKLVMMMQQLDGDLARSIKIPVSDAVVNLELPPADERANTYLGFDADGAPIAVSASINPDDISVSAFMETMLDDANAQTARETIGFNGTGGTVQAADIEADAVTTAKILNLNVTTGKLAANAVTTAKLDNGLILGLSTVTPANDDFLALSDTSDSGNNKKCLVSLIRNKSYRSVTTTDSATAADDVLFLSGASFVQTLFTAVGNDGKVIDIIHDGTSLTQAYTLNTTSGQTIGGIASGAYILYTNGEKLRLVSDGANWKILQHEAITAWALYTATFSAGWGTVSTQEMYWRRSGDAVYVRGTFLQGTVAASIANISLPNSVAALSTTLRTIVGTGGKQINATQAWSIIVDAAGPSVLVVSIYGNVGVDPTTGQNGNVVGQNATNAYVTTGPIGIQGWRP